MQRRLVEDAEALLDVDEARGVVERRAGLAADGAADELIGDVRRHDEQHLGEVPPVLLREEHAAGSCDRGSAIADVQMPLLCISSIITPCQRRPYGTFVPLHDGVDGIAGGVHDRVDLLLRYDQVAARTGCCRPSRA